MSDDGPTFGADPDRVREPEQSVTNTTVLARHFEEQWDLVEPERRAKELNWPTKPWPIGRKTAFMAHLKRTILPGYNDNVPLLLAMIDEFCQHADRYFSPYQNWSVWKQWNQHLDRLKYNVLTFHPELDPGRPDVPDDDAMARHRERLARWDAKEKRQ